MGPALCFSNTGMLAARGGGEKCLRLSLCTSALFIFHVVIFIWVMFLLLHCVPQSHITGVSSHDFLFVYHILASSSHFAAFCLDPVTEEKHLCCTTECQAHSNTDKAPPFYIQCRPGCFGEQLHRDRRSAAALPKWSRVMMTADGLSGQLKPLEFLLPQ